MELAQTMDTFLLTFPEQKSIRRVAFTQPALGRTFLQNPLDLWPQDAT